MRVNRKSACSILGLLAVLCAAIALVSSSASAEVASPDSAEFCNNNTVNNVQKCFGVAREMNKVIGIGHQTGVCVGYDSSGGSCAPLENPAEEFSPLGSHQPWIMGTASASTTFTAVAGVIE